MASPPVGPEGPDSRIVVELRAAKLLALDGIDALAGLQAVGGKVQTYQRLLRLFVSTHDSDGQTLRQLLTGAHAAPAGRLAHHLLGSAAMLGLVDIEAAARALQGGIDQGLVEEQLLTLAQAVDQALALTVQQLRKALAD